MADALDIIGLTDEQRGTKAFSTANGSLLVTYLAETQATVFALESL